jgi:hypothetical protein
MKTIINLLTLKKNMAGNSKLKLFAFKAQNIDRILKL